MGQVEPANGSSAGPAVMRAGYAPLVSASISYVRSMEEGPGGWLGGREDRHGVVSLLALGLVGRTITGRDGPRGGTRLFAAWSAPATWPLGSRCSSPWTAARPCAAGSRRPPSSTASTGRLPLARRHIRPRFSRGRRPCCRGALLGAWLARQLDQVQSPLSGTGAISGGRTESAARAGLPTTPTQWGQRRRGRCPLRRVRAGPSASGASACPAG